MNQKELINLIESIPIDKNEFTILSSGALVLRGILDRAGDLDIAVTKKGLEDLKTHYTLKQKDNGFYTVTEMIECVLDDMIEKKEKVGSYYLQDIHNYLQFLQSSSREKDQLRIPLVEKYIQERKKNDNSNTIVYLIRHSTKFDPNQIEVYNSHDNKQLKTEKKMLSIEGEERAKILSQEPEFQEIDTIYCSNYVRAMQTAKYFLQGRDLKLNIDERLNERKVGDYQKEEYPNFFCDQYWQPEFKAENGESQLEVKDRMTKAFWDIVNQNKQKRIVIVSHGTAISFLLMNWCKLLDVQSNYLRKLEFNKKLVINRIYKAPEVFKLTIDKDNQVVNVENIEFENLT